METTPVQRSEAGAPALMLGAGNSLTVQDVVNVARHRRTVTVSKKCRPTLDRARALVEELARGPGPIYGVNTGFGDLSSVRIPTEQADELQRHLISSHAAGAGEPLPPEAVRAMMILLANSLAKGYSGVRPSVVDTLLALLNEDAVPRVPSRGSVGASGDLVPLAHVALALCGEGQVTYLGDSVAASKVLHDLGVEPLVLQSKEGLALINGTHLMAGLGALLIADARCLLNASEIAATFSFVVMLGLHEALDDRVHVLRRRPRQREVAMRMRALIAESSLRAGNPDANVQDPYTLRCIPQVIGAVLEAVDYIEAAITLELDAVTDNPLCFPDDETVVSGGNFHGQPLSLPLDTLAIALAEMSAFSERRSYRLLSKPAGTNLPPFLSRQPGTQSGLMILQYLAASLVAENQVLAHPAGVASLPTSAGQEDFNSLGATAALKARQVLEHARTIVAVELLCAAQALEFHRPHETSAPLEEAYRRIRAISAAADTDRRLTEEIAALAAGIETGLFEDLLPREETR